MLKTAYLVAYNAGCCVGWFIVLMTCLRCLKDGESATELWNQVEVPLKVSQTIALMEILHSLVGFVRSPISSTIMQVASRIFCLWAIADLSPQVYGHWGFTMMVTSWSLVEVPRYLFYAVNLIGNVPSLLFFLRYHLFMVLYPTGVLGEVTCMIMALSFLTSTGMYAIDLPNPHNLAISLASIVRLVLLTYIPGLPIMYSHMLVQRNRAYSKLKKN